MSKYTTELRFICEELAGKNESEGLSGVADIVELARPKIFDFSYPIFDESYRNGLETKIIRHFYTREIGFEAYGLWKMHLENRMNEIMVLANQRYKSTLLEFNPLFDIDVTTNRDVGKTGNKNDIGKNTENKNSNGKTSGAETNENWNQYSNTPQGRLDDVKTGKYLTEATYTSANNKNNTEYSSTDTNTVDNTLTSNYSDNEDYTERIFGKRGGENYGKMLTDFRNSMIDVDAEVINGLEDLFMSLW